MRRHILIGLAASLALFSLYFGVITIAQGREHAIQQTRDLLPWLLALVTGFGVQAGLFSFVRQRRQAMATASVAASGGVSAGSMAACCAHHLSDVLPFIGLSGAAAFLADYQLAFIVLGLVSNAIGILVMLEGIQKCGMSPRLSAFKLNFGKAKRVALFGAVPLLVLTFLMSSCSSKPAGLPSPPPDPTAPAPSLRAQTDEMRSITFQVTPSIQPGKEAAFSVVMDTHSVSLDFDMVAISSLEDEAGNKYAPLRWDGMPPGGHHRSGTLVFPPLPEIVTSLTLTFTDGTPSRTLQWKLK